MKRRIVSGMMLTLLLAGMLTLAFNIQQAEAAEPPATEWTRTYGGTEGDEGLSLVETSDGGYALAGRTWSSGAGNSDFWLVKVDSSGMLQWNQTYGGTESDYAFSVVESDDGGYVLAGETWSFGAGWSDFWLVKVDSSGNHEWNKTYGGARSDSAFSVVETDDGYALAGETDSPEAGYDSDFWLVKVDSSGNHEWNKTYGRTNDDEVARSMVQTSDGGYALAGYTDSNGAGDYDFWLVKVNSSGVVQWKKTYGRDDIDLAFSVVETDDGYALAGETRSFGAGSDDFWLVKVNSSGTLQWSQTYGGTESDYAYSVVETGDGYALAGTTRSFGAGNTDFWLVKVDSSGTLQWNQTYGGTGWDGVWDGVVTGDGGYAVLGYTESYGAGGGDRDFWLVKVAGPTPVGGIYTPVNKLELLTPYIGLTILLAVAVVTIVFFKRKKRKF